MDLNLLFQPSDLDSQVEQNCPASDESDMMSSCKTPGQEFGNVSLLHRKPVDFWPGSSSQDPIETRPFSQSGGHKPGIHYHGSLGRSEPSESTTFYNSCQDLPFRPPLSTDWLSGEPQRGRTFQRRISILRSSNRKVCKRGMKKLVDDRSHWACRDDSSLSPKTDRKSSHRGHQRPKVKRSPASHPGTTAAAAAGLGDFGIIPDAPSTAADDALLYHVQPTNNAQDLAMLDDHQA